MHATVNMLTPLCICLMHCFSLPRLQLNRSKFLSLCFLNLSPQRPAARTICARGVRLTMSVRLATRLRALPPTRHALPQPLAVSRPSVRVSRRVRAPPLPVLVPAPPHHLGQHSMLGMHSACSMHLVALFETARQKTGLVFPLP